MNITKELIKYLLRRKILRENKNLSLVRLLESWATTDNPINSTEEILSWVTEKNKEINVKIEKIPYNYDGFWYYDKTNGEIKNRNNSFFQIKGLVKSVSTPPRR